MALPPNASGNIVTQYRRADVSPGLLSGLARQYPGYEAVWSGDGRLVLRARRGAAAPATPAPAGAASPGGAAPVPPPPAPPPVSLGQQANIDSIGERLGALPGMFNPRRLALYAEGGRGLTDQGYFDTAVTDVASTGGDGSMSYTLRLGPNGQLYRDSANTITANMNARGMLGSSADREARMTSQRELDNARQRILRQLSASQDDLTRQQTESAAGLRGDLNVARGNYADWQASQPVPPPPPASAPAPTGPAGPAGSNPRTEAGMPRVLRNPGAAWTPERLRALGYAQAGGSYGNNVWTRRG